MWGRRLGVLGEVGTFGGDEGVVKVAVGFDGVLLVGELDFVGATSFDSSFIVKEPRGVDGFFEADRGRPRFGGVRDRTEQGASTAEERVSRGGCGGHPWEGSIGG